MSSLEKERLRVLGRQSREKFEGFTGFRGGVPIGYEIARALNLPLDVMIVRKLGVPGHEELAMGAIASGGVRVLNRSVIESLRIPSDSLEAVEKREALELMRREATYRGNRHPISLKGKTIILVDDGVATGSTMRVAISARNAPISASVEWPEAISSNAACAAASSSVLPESRIRRKGVRSPARFGRANSGIPWVGMALA